MISTNNSGQKIGVGAQGLMTPSKYKEICINTLPSCQDQQKNIQNLIFF